MTITKWVHESQLSINGLDSTPKVVLLTYFTSPAGVCDTVICGNTVVAYDRRSGTSETSEIPDHSFLTFLWSKSNRFWCH